MAAGLTKQALKSITEMPALPNLYLLSHRKTLADSLMKSGLEFDRLFRMKLGPINCVSATHPDVALAILSRPNEFPKSGGQSSPPTLMDSLYLEPTTRESMHLVGVNGAQWTRMRKIMNPAFTNEALFKMIPKFLEETKSVHKLFDRHSETKQPIDVKKAMSKFAMDVLGSSVLGKKFSALEGGFSETVKHYDVIMQASTDPVFAFLPWLEKLPLRRNREVKAGVAYMTDFLNRAVTERRELRKADPSRPNTDFLDCLLAPPDKDPTLQLTNAEMIPNLWVFFFAGHDTTGTALTWLLLSFAQRQDIQEKAREEALRVVGEDGPIEPEHLDQIPYITAVIAESLRLNPPVYNAPTRQIRKDTELDGYLLPKNTIVSIHIGAVNRNAAAWPNPHEFDPNRFLDGQKARGVNYVPFSAGPRRCIGDRFSLMEQKILLLRVLTRYRILPHHNEPKMSNASMPLLFRVPETAYVNLQRL